jgi:hypothetical protein
MPFLSDTLRIALGIRFLIHETTRDLLKRVGKKLVLGLQHARG